MARASARATLRWPPPVPVVQICTSAGPGLFKLGAFLIRCLASGGDGRVISLAAAFPRGRALGFRGGASIEASCAAPPGAPSTLNARGHGLQLAEVTTAAGLRQLRSDWNGVEAAGEPVNPFLSWDWQWTWWETFGASRELRCLVVSEAAQVVGIVPLQSAPGQPQTLSFGGGLDLSDHLGFLFRPGRAGEVATLALEHLALDPGRSDTGPPAPVSLDLHYLPHGSPALQALRQAAQPAELSPELTQEAVSPRVSLPRDFDQYLTGCLNKKDRHELRRKLRRLDLERPEWRLVSQEDLGLEPALDAFFPILKASGAHKQAFLTPEVESFIRGVCGRLEERGWLRLQFIEAGGGLIAATCGFTVSGTWHLYNSGYDPALGALSPGLLCVAEGIKVAIQEGCETADFLRGNEAYKYHLGAVDTPLWRLQLTSAGRSGRVR